MFKAVPEGYNFVEMERKWLDHWYKTDVVKNYLTKNAKSKQRFSFFDGPITANNPMGVHHGWGRTYKDLWQKFHNLLGHKQRFQNGFDCQGLWVEVEVEKELKLKSKKDIEALVPGDRKASIAKFVDLCKQRVYKFSDIQTQQSKRLGYFMDWEHSYFTMSDENNYMIWYFLKQCFENGWIYKGRDSVPWCPRCETAISQHEMLTEDYKELVHEAIFLELPIVGTINEYLLVWTTTPWTIPANIAVAVDEQIEYSLVEGEIGDRYWIAQALIEKVFKKAYKTIVKTVNGSQLVGKKYRGPFDGLEAVKKVAKENPDTFHTIIATDNQILPISTEEGTGLVHTAVSAGAEDFRLGKKYNLPMIPVIADNADYLPDLGFLAGKNAKKHPEIIFDYLKEQEVKGESWIFEIHKYKHRYPACWRCKTELVWKVADEWYIAMDKKINVKRKTQNAKSDVRTLRERMVEVARKITWIPEFGLDRELDWLKNMHDWLISKKNRYWGLALPIFECNECGTFEVIGTKEELQERAIAGWEQFAGHSPHKPYIDEVVIKCSTCGKAAKRINDVGNPWLDAGIIPFSTLVDPKIGKLSYLTDKKYFKDWFPANFITESFPGQFKNWFYSLIAMSTVLENTNSYATVLGFATCVGEDGRPMHKSWGNSIEFNEGAEKIGVDVMRWMYARQNYAENLPFGYKRADAVRRQFYLILWNSYKYFVEYANLEAAQMQLERDHTKWVESKNIIDVWLGVRFHELAAAVETALTQFNPKDAATEIERFVNDLSTWYIRRSRNRVFVHAENSQDKQAFYQTLYTILVNLSIVLSPFLPYITEEIYTTLTRKASVHLETWPTADKQKINKELLTDMTQVRELLEVGHRIRKELKFKVRQPLAAVSVTLPKSKQFLLQQNISQYHQLIKEELNVKNIRMLYQDTTETVVEYDIRLTPELEAEGAMRELVRTVQAERKMKGIKLTDLITLTIPREFAAFAEQIKKLVVARTVEIGSELKIQYTSRSSVCEYS